MKETNSLATPNFDAIDPRNCVNAKLRKLHRLINSAYLEKFKSFGLKGSMISILFIIGKKKGVNQKFIADALVLDQSTMSRDLKKLITKGWVKSFKGDDTRKSHLELSREGHLLLEKIAPIWSEMNSKTLELLGSFNIQQIDNITIAINSNLLKLKN